MEDLPLGRIAALVPEYAMKDLSLGRTLMMMISRRLSWGGHVARMELSRNAYRALEGRPKGKRPLGRPRSRWEDIKMDLRGVGCDPGDWIELFQGRDQWQAYVRAVMNLRVP